LPEHVTLLARFAGEPAPVKSTVTKAVAEFRRTHADTWNVQKNSFTEEQLEVASQKYYLSKNSCLTYTKKKKKKDL
jgi:ethanolamine utilization microcompartment shell protein EutL